MSDLAATGCGCASNEGGCNWIIILLLLCCCGCGGNNNMFGGCQDNCGSLIFILLIPIDNNIPIS